MWRSLRLQALADSPDAFAHTLEEEQAHPDEWWIDIVTSTVEHPRGALWFAEVDVEPLGMVFARIDESLTNLEIGAMWVAPTVRRRGLGRALLSEALEWGREAGASTAVLWVATANPEAATLYQDSGFAPTGAAKPLRPGSTVTAHELARPLTR